MPDVGQLCARASPTVSVWTGAAYLVGGLGDGEQQLLHGGLQACADGVEVLLVLQRRPGGQRALQQLLGQLQALVRLRLARPHARVIRRRLAAVATL